MSTAHRLTPRALAAVGLLSVLLFAGLESAAAPPQGPFMSEHRVEKDAERDAVRYPNELMAFLAIQPGSTVVDLGAGDGYTSMYLAREVGPTGRVYAQNPASWKEFVEPGRAAREATGPLDRITWVTRDFESPIPEELTGVDWVTNVLTYHDTLYMPVDRDAMNTAIFSALKPGGHYVIVDHDARKEDGVKVGQTLHRVAEAAVIAEVQRAGFVLESTSPVLRDASDDHTGVAYQEPQPSTDRFVLSFVKPE